MSKTLTFEHVLKRIIPLVPNISVIWSQNVRQSLGQELPFPHTYMDYWSTLIIRSLTEDVKDDIHICSLAIGNWLWTHKTPISLLFRMVHLYRTAFWEVVRPALPFTSFSSPDFVQLEQHIEDTIHDAVSLAIHYYEQKYQHELQEKDQTIHFLNNDKLTILDKIAANLAHELRNPLCAIEGFLKLIRESTQGNQELESYINVILHEFESLHRQITGFLSFCKKPILDEVFQPLHITDLLQQVEGLLTPRLHAESVTLQQDIQPCTFYGYEAGLLQVLTHLFNNAIDAVGCNTDKRISLIACHTDDVLSIIVANNGEPIPHELQSKLFQPFFSTKDDSTGIGLSICKNIIDKHQGTIACHSTPEQTQFLIRLPLHTTSHI
ncbi:sensor histidine kinase [Brevibacillus dissolubilis]|uniref:sensor histidine kinase n=1 Tax=Brevibacillus dissolubilis TaxID=1844116 RepID=UPI00210019EF|nr:HAMP domain-containing sensor histidine kinase [Brevibacillus dissolubilis]